MKNYNELVHRFKNGDEDVFFEILDEFNPLIIKYSSALYKDEFDDIKSELILALWQALCKIKAYDESKQIVKYISNAMHMKFLELYRNSKSYHDNELLVTNDDYFSNIQDLKSSVGFLVIKADVDSYIETLTGKKKTIADYIIYQQYSDIQISEALNISRQYVNRVRREVKSYFNEVWKDG
ncbi:RNA polymerase sigma factor [Pseudobutyrivibrio sp.]|jgi:RNA polymerase sigma factor (sigma-70 family)|uniref:RNA polymerase sigma factor n=1 Tax=Pseudobutyrivibrio sp. TaxID=2014367 RepID=UPI0025D58D16|nr:sigma-70 family RNA polymerase sigma factor [Pseudobutyrivibrio sp.]